MQLHSTLNVVKGTVYSETMSNSTEEEIMKEQRVTKMERMKRRVDGKLLGTHRYILAFNRTKLPPLIKLAEWHREIVDLYIPTPMRCNRCQRYNHAKKWCRREKERCGEEDHTANQCNNEPHCVNCSRDHWSTDKNCDRYLFRCEVMATRHENTEHRFALACVPPYYSPQALPSL